MLAVGVTPTVEPVAALNHVKALAPLADKIAGAPGQTLEDEAVTIGFGQVFTSKLSMPISVTP